MTQNSRVSPVTVEIKKSDTVCNNGWNVVLYVYLKFVSNKYTVLYFREDKSTCRICTVTVEEPMLLILLQSFLHTVWNLTYICIKVIFVVCSVQVMKSEDENKMKIQDVGAHKTFHIYEKLFRT